MRSSVILPGALALGAALAVGCGPPPAPAPLPPATVKVDIPAVPTATATADPGPSEPLPSMHPCVPDFIVKDLHGCEPGSAPTDYSSVANAMAAMVAAGPIGPRGGDRTVQRPLERAEEKAAGAARAFLCVAPAGEPDDEHATTAFDLGRLFLNANHFEEAAVYLRDAAVLDPQKHAEAEYAARFLLDAVRALAGSRPECKGALDALSAAVDLHVCKGPGAEGRAETCEAIAKAKAGAQGTAH